MLCGDQRHEYATIYLLCVYFIVCGILPFRTPALYLPTCISWHVDIYLGADLLDDAMCASVALLVN